MHTQEANIEGRTCNQREPSGTVQMVAVAECTERLVGRGAEEANTEQQHGGGELPRRWKALRRHTPFVNCIVQRDSVTLAHESKLNQAWTVVVSV